MGEFCWNFVLEDLIDVMNMMSKFLVFEESEFDYVGF